MIHIHLNYLGYQFKKDDKLEEWFIDCNEVRQIFHISQAKLEKKIWSRRNIFFYDSLFTERKNRNPLMRNLYYNLKNRLGIKKSLEIDMISEWFDVKVYESNYSGYNVILNDYDKILQNFLDNKFYKTKLFEVRMRLYCEFVDVYKDNQQIMNILDVKIKDPSFKKYYGTKGCRARGYRRNELESRFVDSEKNKELTKKIISIFVPGDRLTKSEIKSKLQRIYDDLGLSRKAKATDLQEYFNLVRTKLSGKEGFKILEKL